MIFKRMAFSALVLAAIGHTSCQDDVSFTGGSNYLEVPDQGNQKAAPSPSVFAPNMFEQTILSPDEEYMPSNSWQWGNWVHDPERIMGFVSGWIAALFSE